MNEQTEQPIHWNRIKLNDLDAKLILDVGGGGEGLVSRIAQDRVCAVDIKLSEVREARIYDPESNWFVADARDLPFKDETFDLATFWYSLMFMRHRAAKKTALQETFRVLRRGGRLHIMAAAIEPVQDPFFFRAVFTLPDGTLSKIGYGVGGKQEQNLDSMIRLVEEVGFQIDRAEDNGSWFVIDATRPVQ